MNNRDSVYIKDGRRSSLGPVSQARNTGRKQNRAGLKGERQKKKFLGEVTGREVSECCTYREIQK